MADTEPNGVDVWLIKWAISNCHTLARRRIKAGSTDSDWWGHVLRLCEKAGAKSLGVLRVGECDALGQAATDAEALEAKDKEIVRLTESRNEIITRNAEMFKELRQAWPALGRCVQQKEALQDSLTAERQKIRELREWLAFTDFPTGFRVMGKTLPDQHHSDCSCREGQAHRCAGTGEL